MSEEQGTQKKYAIVEHGGKQYRVEEGDVFTVDSVEGEAGQVIDFGRALLYGNGSGTKIGTPTVAGVKIQARIMAHERAKKILVFKFKRRKNFRKIRGHRQEITRLKIESISIA